MNHVKVVSSGIALIQDLGRPDFQHLGVPTSGAFDKERYRDLTTLMQAPTTPVIELWAGELRFDISCSTQFAVLGAEGLLNHHPIAEATVLQLTAGDQVRLWPRASGSGPAYVAIRGLECTQVLGSASRDTMSELGPLPIRAGDVISIDESRNHPQIVGSFLIPPSSRSPKALRAVAGPHTPLPDHALTVRSVARSGVRLSADSAFPIDSLQVSTLPSLPVLPGAIQITPSGETIILGPDSGVTGGYPIAGVILDTDFSLIAHLKVGDIIRFIDTDIELAKTLDKDHRDARSAVVSLQLL